MNQNAEPNFNKSFICGVCEGFYGKPWSFSQRQELFKRMQRFGMNTYLYAPKDDYKHRLYWRELYNDDEADELKCLIRFSLEYNINFVYAISPGLDIIYSNDADVTILKKKLDQVKSLGCQCFSLLFDDIEDDLCREDMHKFASIADAQCFLTNDIYEHLGRPDLFLFCPTEYCSSRSLPDVVKSPYLKTIGYRLNKNIEFLWTGPKVVSRRITVENVDEVSEIIKRPVTIWDNLHANDYDQTRIYLGPYTGRPTELLSKLRGVLTNPNCEFEANFVALHTLAQWSRNTNTRFQNPSPPLPVATRGEADMEVEDSAPEPAPPPMMVPPTAPAPPASLPSPPSSDGHDNDHHLVGPPDSSSSSKPLEKSGEYDPRKALQMAILDWLPELYKFKSSFGHKGLSDKSSSSSAFASKGNVSNDLTKPSKLLGGGGVGGLEADIRKSNEDIDFEIESVGGNNNSNNIINKTNTEEDLKKLDEDVPMLEEDESTSMNQQHFAAADKTTTDPKKDSSGSTAAADDDDDDLAKKEQMTTSLDTQANFIPGGVTMTNSSATNFPQQQQQQQQHSGFYMRRQHDTYLSCEDLTMVCDFFYLPFEHGPMGEHMLKVARWLVDNFHLVYRSPQYPHPFTAYIPPPPPPPTHPPPHPSLLPLATNATTSSCPSPLCDDRSAYSTSPDSPILDQGCNVEGKKSDVHIVGSSCNPPIICDSNKGMPLMVNKDRYQSDNYFVPSSTSEWYERAIRFHDGYGDLSAVVDKLVNIPNRELLYEIYKYVNDMRSNLALVNSYIKWHGIDKREKELFKSGEQEPWVHRGGLLAEFRRLLPFERDSSQSRSNNVFVVRPYYPSDKAHVNMICLRTYNDMMDGSYWLGSIPDLIGDCIVGAFLKFYGKFCFVLEDNLGVCSYVVAADDNRCYDDRFCSEWLPELRLKYPLRDDKKISPLPPPPLPLPLPTVTIAPTTLKTSPSSLTTNKDDTCEVSNKAATTATAAAPPTTLETTTAATAATATTSEEASKQLFDKKGGSVQPHSQHHDEVVADDDDDGPYPMSSSSSTEQSRNVSPDNDLYHHQHGYSTTFVRPRFYYHTTQDILQSLHSDVNHFNISSVLLKSHDSVSQNTVKIAADDNFTDTTTTTTATTTTTTTTDNKVTTGTIDVSGKSNGITASEFLKIYPSIIQISLLRGRGSPAKLLLASAEQALANSGSPGMHVVVPENHKSTIEMYKNLGFHEEKIKDLNTNLCEGQLSSNEEGCCPITTAGPPDNKATTNLQANYSIMANFVVLCKSIEAVAISNSTSPDKLVSSGSKPNPIDGDVIKVDNVVEKVADMEEKQEVSLETEDTK